MPVNIHIEDQRREWIAAARELGIEHAKNAASWAYDDSSDPKERAKVLQMMRDGDPEAYDYLPPQPNLSGEWADSLTPRSLFERVTGLDAHAEATWNVDAYDGVLDELCQAYEDAVDGVFSITCEYELVRFLASGSIWQ